MMGRTIGKKQKKVKTTRLLILAALVVIVIGAFIYQYVYRRAKIYPINPGPTIQDEGTKRSQGQTSQPGQNSDNSSSAQTAGGSLGAPTLIKSSGNNGAVPEGAMIEFVCQSVDGASCDIVLTSSTNKNNIIKLGSKTITDNGRGEFAAFWDWTAQKGSWNVIAQATRNGASAASPTQVLEVK